MFVRGFNGPKNRPVYFSTGFLRQNAQRFKGIMPAEMRLYFERIAKRAGGTRTFMRWIGQPFRL
jgi:hypothetical protein